MLRKEYAPMPARPTPSSTTMSGLFRPHSIILRTIYLLRCRYGFIVSREPINKSVRAAGFPRRLRLGGQALQGRRHLDDAARHHALARPQRLQRPPAPLDLLLRRLHLLRRQLGADVRNVLEAPPDRHAPQLERALPPVLLHEHQ